MIRTTRYYKSFRSDKSIFFKTSGSSFSSAADLGHDGRSKSKSTTSHSFPFSLDATTPLHSNPNHKHNLKHYQRKSDTHSLLSTSKPWKPPRKNKLFPTFRRWNHVKPRRKPRCKTKNLTFSHLFAPGLQVFMLFAPQSAQQQLSAGLGSGSIATEPVATAHEPRPLESNQTSKQRVVTKYFTPVGFTVASTFMIFMASLWVWWQCWVFALRNSLHFHLKNALSGTKVLTQNACAGKSSDLIRWVELRNCKNTSVGFHWITPIHNGSIKIIDSQGIHIWLYQSILLFIQKSTSLKNHQTKPPKQKKTTPSVVFSGWLSEDPEGRNHLGLRDPLMRRARTLQRSPTSCSAGVRGHDAEIASGGAPTKRIGFLDWGALEVFF